MAPSSVVINEFLRYAISGVLATLATANFALSMKSFEMQEQPPGYEALQYYALAVGFSIIIASNEAPLTSFIIIVFSFIPKIQATPGLLWLAYRLMIPDSHRSVISVSYSNLSDASTASPTQTTYEPTLLTSLKTAKAPTWV